MNRIMERAEAWQKLDRELRQYINTHQLQNKLENRYCFLRYNITDSGTITLSCRERSMGNKIGRTFTIRGDNDHAATMWALINMKFSSSTTYESLLKLYNYYNNGNSYYLYANNEQYYRIATGELEADNEYCEMTMIKKSNNGTTHSSCLQPLKEPC
jgi:hypothetical protein